MKAYYCTCLVKTGVCLYLAASTVLSTAILAVTLQDHILASVGKFLEQAVANVNHMPFDDLDFNMMKRTLAVLLSLVVCFVNVVINIMALVAIYLKKHSLLTPWLFIGVLEILAIFGCGAYHLYLLWTTHEIFIYQLDGRRQDPIGPDMSTSPTKSPAFSLETIVALRSSLSFSELVIYTCLASGGVLLYLAFLVYAWVMVKVLRDQLRESSAGTAFVMKIVKQL